MENYEDDDPWMWVALAPGCRLIVAFAIGPRKQYVADEFFRHTTLINVYNRTKKTII